jgi:protein involved in polysaccharide export with SLBB domain
MGVLYGEVTVMFRRAYFLVVLIFQVAFSLPAPQAQEAARQEVDARGKQFASRNPRYQIRAADVIELLFSATPEFNQTLSVQPDGYITLREVGDIHVQGKTLLELTESITAAYQKILHKPVITLVLKDFEKPHFTVGGQVGRPGKYDLRADTTVVEAVAIAGGLTPKAKHSQVLLFRRVSDEWAQVRELNLKEILGKGRLQEDLHLRPGDMLFVPQNRISKVQPFLPAWSISTYPF